VKGWGRIALLVLAVVVVVVCLPANLRRIRHLMLPATPPFDLTISFHHLNPSPKGVGGDITTDGTILKILSQLDLHGTPDGSSTFMGFTNVSPTGEVRVVMLAEGPVLSDTQLPLPSSGSIVYLFKDGGWKSYPSISDPAKQRIRVVHDPGLPGRFSLEVTGIRWDQSYTYTPPDRVGE
jgi:hypothetical protein